MFTFSEEALAGLRHNTLDTLDLSGFVPKILPGFESKDKRVFHFTALTDGRFACLTYNNREKRCQLEILDALSGASISIRHGSEIEGVRALAMLPDGRLVLGCHDGTVELCDPISGTCLRRFESLTDTIASLATLPDGRLAVTSYKSSISCNPIQIFDMATGSCIKTLGDNTRVIALTALPDGSLLTNIPHPYHGSVGLQILDATMGKSIKQFQRNNARVFTVLPGARLAVLDNGARSIQILDLASGTCIKRLEGAHDANIQWLGTLPNGCLVSSSSDKPIQIWPDISTELLALLQNNTSIKQIVWGNSQAYLPQEQIEAINGIGLRNQAASRAVIQEPIPMVRSLALPADMLEAIRSNTLQTLDLSRFINLSIVRVGLGMNTGVRFTALLPDGRIALNNSSRVIEVWDTISGTRIRQLEGHTDHIYALAALSDGRLASASSDKTIRIWDAATGACSRVLEGHTDRVGLLAVLPDSRLASGSIDKTIRIWDTLSGTCVTVINTGINHSSLVALSNNRLATVSDSEQLVGSPALGNTRTIWGPINIWDVATGAYVKSLACNQNVCPHLAALPDGRLAVSGYRDGNIRIWDAISGVWVATLAGPRGNEVMTVLSDGRLALNTGWYTSCVWDMTTGTYNKFPGYESKTTPGRSPKTDCNFRRIIETLSDGRLMVAAKIGIGTKSNHIEIWPHLSADLLALLQSNTSIKAIILGDAQKYLLQDSIDVLNALCQRNRSELAVQVRARAASGSGESAARAGAGGPDDSAAAAPSDPTVRWPSIEPLQDLLNKIIEANHSVTVAEPEAAHVASTVADPEPVVDTSGAIAPPPFASEDITVQDDPVPQAEAAAAVIPAPRTAPVSLLRQIAANDIRRGRKLGSGSFGDVYFAVWNGEEVAVKELNLPDDLSHEALAELQHEAEMMANLPHPRIVPLYAVCLEPNHYSIVMEYLINGSLYSFLQDSGRDIPASLQFRMAREIAAGLSFLHGNHILHRDVKSLNVLLDNELHAKIGDFGLAKIRTESTRTSSRGFRGSLLWASPEALNEERQSEASDVYSFGVVLWELFTRLLPFKGLQSGAVVVAVMSGRRGEMEKIPATTPAEIKELIKRCWNMTPGDRPSLQEAMLIFASATTPAAAGAGGPSQAADVAR